MRLHDNETYLVTVTHHLNRWEEEKISMISVTDDLATALKTARRAEKLGFDVRYHPDHGIFIWAFRLGLVFTSRKSIFERRMEIREPTKKEKIRSPEAVGIYEWRESWNSPRHRSLANRKSTSSCR